VQRRRSGSTLWFLVNHGESDVTLPVAPRGRDLATGREVTGPLSLGPFGVAVVET
jgi:beta-galactosidase GanA